jgi:hypothetical protein
VTVRPRRSPCEQTNYGRQLAPTHEPIKRISMKSKYTDSYNFRYYTAPRLPEKLEQPVRKGVSCAQTRVT